MGELHHECGIAALYHLDGPDVSPIAPSGGPDQVSRLADHGTPVTRFRAEDEHDEAWYVAREVERLVTEQAEFSYRDIAVFYRTNAQSRVIEDVFMKSGIPYRVVGGVRFYERREIKDVLAYLRALVNPQDAVSMRRVINTPKRGIGDQTVGALEAFAREGGVPAGRRDRRPVAEGGRSGPGLRGRHGPAPGSDAGGRPALAPGGGGVHGDGVRRRA